jgi:two-component system, OmpR family, alkaline phosphatase synthesis response regulator PhoP
MKKILLIEDDKTLRLTLSLAMKEEEFDVTATGDGQEGLKLALAGGFDLIALDMVLPGLGGLEICRQVREMKIGTPIIMISGKKKDEIDKVLGLELGADDYLTKPFGPRELLARIKAVLRRSEPKADSELAEFSFGNVYINFKKQIARKGERELSLTAKEFALLRLFVTHEGDVISRNMILDDVWGYEKFPTTRTVDTFVHNLRQKIEDEPSRPRHLLTIPWSGYKFLK